MIVDTNGKGQARRVRRGRTSRSIPPRTSASSPASTACSRARPTARSGASRWTSASRASTSPATSSASSRAPTRRTPALTEIYPPPAGASARAASTSTSDGVVWTHAGQRPHGELRPAQVQGPADRAECGDRQACARRAGRSTAIPGPQFAGVDRDGSAEPRLLRVGRPLQHARPRQRRADRQRQRQRSRCPRWWTASWSTIRVPYPLGFFTKNVDGRIDDPNAGWRGSGLWTTTGTRTVVPQRRRHGRTGRRSTRCRCARIRSRADRPSRTM